MVMDTDPYGNFLTHGYESASGRDWARIANLYLQDGVWNGERILPEGYAKFVGTLAPAWVADKRPQYGGLFWVNGDGGWPAPKDMYFMSGVGGQQVHDHSVTPAGRRTTWSLQRFTGCRPRDAQSSRTARRGRAARAVASRHREASARQRCDAKTLVLPDASNAITSYGVTVPPGTSIPGEPAGIPGAAIPSTLGRVSRSFLMSATGTCPSIR